MMKKDIKLVSVLYMTIWAGYPNNYMKVLWYIFGSIDGINETYQR